MDSDIDIVSYYLSGLSPTKVHSFGSIGHFKKSRKPVEAGDAVNCFDCAYEAGCPWSAKKIYIDTLSQEKEEKVSFRPRCGPSQLLTVAVGEAFCRGGSVGRTKCHRCTPWQQLQPLCVRVRQ